MRARRAKFGRDRKLARVSFACPKCGAPAGVSCRRADGTERRSNHVERYSEAATVEGRIAMAHAVRDPSEGFYWSQAWRIARYEVLKRSRGLCELCGAGPSVGKPLHVDHIKPRSFYPALQLELSNLQVMCADCNLGKGANDCIDWRTSP